MEEKEIKELIISWNFSQEFSCKHTQCALTQGPILGGLYGSSQGLVFGLSRHLQTVDNVIMCLSAAPSPPQVLATEVEHFCWFWPLDCTALWPC